MQNLLLPAEKETVSDWNNKIQILPVIYIHFTV
jgi:hypothetical protein